MNDIWLYLLLSPLFVLGNIAPEQIGVPLTMASILGKGTTSSQQMSRSQTPDASVGGSNALDQAIKKIHDDLANVSDDVPHLTISHRIKDQSAEIKGRINSVNTNVNASPVSKSEDTKPSALKTSLVDAEKAHDKVSASGSSFMNVLGELTNILPYNPFGNKSSLAEVTPIVPTRIDSPKKDTVQNKWIPDQLGTTTTGQQTQGTPDNTTPVTGGETTMKPASDIQLSHIQGSAPSEQELYIPGISELDDAFPGHSQPEKQELIDVLAALKKLVTAGYVTPHNMADGSDSTENTSNAQETRNPMPSGKSELHFDIDDIIRQTGSQSKTEAPEAPRVSQTAHGNSMLRLQTPELIPNASPPPKSTQTTSDLNAEPHDETELHRIKKMSDALEIFHYVPKLISQLDRVQKMQQLLSHLEKQLVSESSKSASSSPVTLQSVTPILENSDNDSNNGPFASAHYPRVSNIVHRDVNPVKRTVSDSGVSDQTQWFTEGSGSYPQKSTPPVISETISVQKVLRATPMKPAHLTSQKAEDFHGKASYIQEPSDEEDSDTISPSADPHVDTEDADEDALETDDTSNHSLDET